MLWGLEKETLNVGCKQPRGLGRVTKRGRPTNVNLQLLQYSRVCNRNRVPAIPAAKVQLWHNIWLQNQ